MKKILALILAVMTMMTVAGCSGTTNDTSATSDDVKVWRFCHEESVGSVQDQFAMKFKELVEEKSDGKIRVDVYPVGQLADGVGAIELLRYNAVNFAINNPATVATIIPENQLLMLHYVFSDDMEVNGMVYASAVRSAYPRAIVKAIRMEKALEANGILAIYTADDIPGSVKTGHLKQDWDAMIPIGKITHYLGDAICLVVGETREAVEAAKKLVEVDYEPLEMIQNPYEAMREGAPLVHSDGNLLAHKHVSRGNADKAIANAKYVVSGQFHTPFTEHAFLEPETAVAEPTEDGGVQVYSSDQGVYDTRRECAALLGLPMEKVRVTNKLVGGGFGGKEDMTVQHHAALVAYLLKRPVKVSLTRKESILIHPKRHAMDTKMTMGCDENGIILGVKAEVISDTGAYASLGGPVLERACTHAAGPYNYQNFEIDGKAY